MMTRKQCHSDLIYKLGLLLSPLQEICDHPDRFDAPSRTTVSAKFFANLPEVEREFYDFATNQAGHVFRREWTSLHAAFHTLASGVENHLDNPEQLKTLLEEKSDTIINTLSAIPIPTGASILAAHTPFTTHCMLKDLCQSASSTVIWVDRYLDATLFYRYLRDISQKVQVTLLTWPDTKRNAKEYSEFIDISRLYAAERHPDNYRLVVHIDIHDRWLCCDDQIYSLGGSVKDAGNKCPFTLANIDPSPKNFQKITKYLNTGNELFGPNSKQHP